MLESTHPPGSIERMASPEVWWRRPRWRWAALGFLVGALETMTAMLIGAEVRFADRDVTLLAGGIVEVTFATFGYLVGLTREARARERIQLARLAEVRQRLHQAEKLASLGALASAIAHEVRNPLAILRARLQNLEEGLPSNASDARRDVGELFEEIDRLAHVTGSLVDFARPLVLQRHPVSAGELLARIDQLAAPMLRDVPVMLQVDPAPASMMLDVDADLLCQALLGLIENAARAAPGGRVQVTLDAVDASARLDVRDEGPGVPADLRERIFEPFFTTRTDGTGLGLAVVRQIIQAHGGEITVSAGPAPGTELGGACFSIFLPVERHATAAA